MTVAEGNTLESDNQDLRRQVEAMEQLLDVQKYTMLEQIARYEESLRQVRERTSELAKTNTAMSQLTAAMEQSMDGIALTDMEGRVTFVNESWADMHGWNVDELVGQSMSIFYTAEQMATEVKLHHAKVAEMGAQEGEVSHVAKDGAEFPTNMSTSCLRNSTGKTVGLVSIARDITESKKAAVELETVHQELLQASRMAGMSEVATGVLHNVGNVLNSVNVAANLVTERVRKSRIAELEKAGKIVAEHVDDMAAFVTEHPQGKYMGNYIIEIAEYLALEQQEILDTLAGLRKNIEHIKVIVARQQSLVQSSSVIEEVSPQELIEDALRLHSASFGRHKIEVVRDYCEIPSVMIDRHNVLQILVNLVGNAKQAMTGRGRMGGILTLRASWEGRDNIRFEVIDDGIGISEANLEKVFNFGFTTRKEGHGFGLHTGCLAAMEMGGTLTAHSEGQGKGATFVLEIPLQKKAACEAAS